MPLLRKYIITNTPLWLVQNCTVRDAHSLLSVITYFIRMSLIVIFRKPFPTMSRKNDVTQCWGRPHILSHTHRGIDVHQKGLFLDIFTILLFIFEIFLSILIIWGGGGQKCLVWLNMWHPLDDHCYRYITIKPTSLSFAMYILHILFVHFVLIDPMLMLKPKKNCSSWVMFTPHITHKTLKGKL